MTDRRPVAPLLAPLLLLLLAATGCGESGQQYATNLGEAIDRSKAMSVRGDMQKIAAAITSYVTQEAELPALGDIQGLAGVLEPNWLRHVPTSDPWGTDYRFSADGSSYTIESAGQDKAWGTGDDMVMEDGQLTKMPEGFQRL